MNMLNYQNSIVGWLNLKCSTGVKCIKGRWSSVSAKRMRYHGTTSIRLFQQIFQKD
jgi:hypothetical protein